MARRDHVVDSLAASQRLAGRAGFTLVEMLVAMAITLVMMAAVVTLFANVSNSVRNRRATIEMTGQLRHLRAVLQQDLQGATCPGLTWQRPESNHGYIEVIEGQYRDAYPSMLTDGIDQPTPPNPNPELDAEQSLVPRANDGSLVQRDGDNNVLSTANGLGDYDDILMLTVRNEHEPFVGRVPANVRANNGSVNSFANWQSTTTESQLAEVVWFAVENPVEAESANNFFGEPGMRTIYRRTLLIAPWLEPYRATGGNNPEMFDFGGPLKSEPGLVRVLSADVSFDEVDQALAALVAFQDRYDLSVRLEWDYNLSRWKIMANTLGDLTKRENRFGHFGLHFDSSNSRRVYPYAAVSAGSGYSGSGMVGFVMDPEIEQSAPSTPAQATANVLPSGNVSTYSVTTPGEYRARPLAFVAERSNASATARAMLNDQGQVVRVIHGFVPLWGTRRGEDVMMTDALAFDLRVYDPAAPLYQETITTTVLEPSDFGWRVAYHPSLGSAQTGFTFIGQGAYVDLGYAFGFSQMPFVPVNTSWSWPWFAEARALSDVLGRQLAPGYSVYDTWSYHYETNGRDDDGDNVIDEGTNGIDDVGSYANPTPPPLMIPDTRLGPDDVGERETVPPYDKPLRGMQVLVRVYERDSRAIRQVRVNQHFMPE